MKYRRAVRINRTASRGAKEVREMDIQKEMAVGQGYVPSTCIMPGQMVMALVTSEGDPCKGCNADRSVCKGRPRCPTEK